MHESSAAALTLCIERIYFYFIYSRFARLSRLEKTNKTWNFPL